MSQAVIKRSRLLVGCGSAALALGLIFGPTPAAAQGIQASGNVVFGSAGITNPGPNDTNVDIISPTVVIDWTPNEDAGGNALTFLPAGSTATYQSSQLADFAVLNRILPATNGNIAVIDGAVIARVAGAAGPVPGGFVAFYSPTGLLIGSTATFDVGRLLLTTLDTTDTNFDAFAQQGGSLSLTGAAGSTARIAIAPGAQIFATPENAFFAVVAADVEMRGSARINGSHAYVAAEVVNLSFSNGLFDIFVPVGTAASGEVVTLDGTIGGPSSTGNSGDNHMIYGVARASTDPISMLFRGNLGFDAAQTAGVVNGEIILAANYNVSGRFVDGGDISQGIDAAFGASSALTNVRADITLADVDASSSLLAIGTHRVAAGAVGAPSTFAGNLLLVGRESASLTASGGNGLSVSGNVLVDSRDYGVSGPFLQSLTLADAQGGTALIEATAGGTITLNSDVRVLADAFAGADDTARAVGSARGGTAAISGNGGTVSITGNATISARGIGSLLSDVLTGADSRGGSAEVRARAGGSVTIGQALEIDTAAFGAQGSLFSPSTQSDAFGGASRISLLEGGGTITVGGPARLDASALGGSANTTGPGAIGDAGEATVVVVESGLVDLQGTLQLFAVGNGGSNALDTGGTGLGGRASLFTIAGGTIRVGGNFDAIANGLGGAGVNGGDAFGGIAGANARIGLIDLLGPAFIDAGANGGDAAFGFGGNGGLGRGGNSFLQADGSLAQGATVSVGGEAFLYATGVGGRGGDSDGSTIAAGRGGDGFGGSFGVPNQADPAFNSGSFVLAGGDRGSIAVGGSLITSSSGFGGDGGNGAGTFEGGRGGDGFGGLTQTGLALFGLNGSVGLGTASFGDVFAAADGVGGRGGLSGAEFITGDGGTGTGGAAVVTVRAGDITAGFMTLHAAGLGGSGRVAGSGIGGDAAVFGSLGGTLTVDTLSLFANGFGGSADLGTGGTALGASPNWKSTGRPLSLTAT